MIILLFNSSFIFAQGDTIRIACIGNSITEGDGLKIKTLDSYPPQLKMLLGENYKVFNFGKSGRTMLKNGDAPYWNESAFTEALNSDPDIVTILLGTNDSRSVNRALIDDYFYSDYQAMIDTFAQLDRNPQIWVCYPPPSFSDNFNISDSIIVHKIRPNIDLLLDNNPEISFIDFYNILLNKSHLFPDGIHPSVDGAWEMAKILADSLAGVKVESENEVNLAKNKQVTVNAFDELFPPEGLNDGDRLTRWKADGFNNWAIINIGYIEEIDMFLVDFGDAFNKGFQYTIDVSSDSVDWTTVVDHTVRNDTVTQIVVDKIDPTMLQYIKITVTGASNSEQDITSISEFKILKSAFVHCPVLNWRLRILREDRLAYYLDVIPTFCDEELIKYCIKVDDGFFSSSIGFRPAEMQEKIETMNAGEVHHIYTETYKNGKILISDTVSVSFDYFTTVDQTINQKPPLSYNLCQNYPNPFNPRTTIKFSLNQRTHVQIQIFDVLGRNIRILSDKYYNAGNYSIDWDGRDGQGNTVASGVYFYRLKLENYSSPTHRMVFVK